MKTAHPKFRGVWTAIATPFESNGTIDWKAYEAHLRQQEAGGVTGIVVSGTTGEAPTLSVQEKLAMLRKAKAVLSPKTRIMAGSGGNSTEQSVELSKLAVEAGADSLLIVTPPYNKPSMAGLKLHFSMIAKASSVPLCLYHVPGRTNQKLTAEQMASLAEIESIHAIKEASADLALFSDTRAKTKAAMLSGDDITFLPSLSVGGDGIISVLTNLYPEAFCRMMRHFEAGKVEDARAVHFALTPAINALFVESNPGPLKAAMSIKGLSGDHLRAPLAPVTEANYKVIQQALAETDRALGSLK